MSNTEEAKKRLRGVMKEFSLGLADEVLDELKMDLMPKSTDFNNQGEKCEPGQDGFISKEQFESRHEAVYDQNNLLPVHFLTEGAIVQKAIAMVTLKVAKYGLAAGKGIGSGFLISDSLFMTNNHVIRNKADCNDVNMQFMYQDNYGAEPAITPEFFETNENSFFHTNAGLDYTIVRLKRKPYRFRPVRRIPVSGGEIVPEMVPFKHDYADSEQIEELEYIRDFITKEVPISEFDTSRVYRIFGYTAGSKYGSIALRPIITYPATLRLNVIQHPKGRKKEVVVQQNEITDVHTNVIHYYSDTDYGSSGSPVFNNAWDLMALHHAREPSENANEGIRIDKIVSDLRNEFQASKPEILTELGI